MPSLSLRRECSFSSCSLPTIGSMLRMIWPSMPSRFQRTTGASFSAALASLAMMWVHPSSIRVSMPRLSLMPPSLNASSPIRSSS